MDTWIHYLEWKGAPFIQTHTIWKTSDRDVIPEVNQTVGLDGKLWLVRHVHHELRKDVNVHEIRIYVELHQFNGMVEN